VNKTLKDAWSRTPNVVTDFVETKPKWVTFSILGGLAASMVGINMYVRREREFYAAPPTIQRGWTEIKKAGESEQTAMMRHQYTDFGSFYRGPVNLAARLKVAIPKGAWEGNQKTIFQRAEAFFKPGMHKELTPYSKIKGMRKELVDVAPTTEGRLAFRPGPDSLPGTRLTAEISKNVESVAMERSLASMAKPTRVPHSIDAASESWLLRHTRARSVIPPESARNSRILPPMPIHPDGHLVLDSRPIGHTNFSPFRHNHLFGNALRP
jgi:hypothetical protein